MNRVFQALVRTVNGLDRDDIQGSDYHGAALLTIFVILNGLVALVTLPLALITLFPDTFQSFRGGLLAAVPFSILVMALDTYVVGAKTSLGRGAVDFTPRDIISFIETDENGDGVQIQRGAIPSIPSMPNAMYRVIGLLPRFALTLVLAGTVGTALNLAINQSAIAREQADEQNAYNSKLRQSDKGVIAAKSALTAAKSDLARSERFLTQAKKDKANASSLYGCEYSGEPKTWPGCTGRPGPGRASDNAYLQVKSAGVALTAASKARTAAESAVDAKQAALDAAELRATKAKPAEAVTGWLGAYRAFDSFAAKNDLGPVARYWPEGLVLVLDSIPLLMKLFLGLSNPDILWWRRNYARHYSGAVDTRVTLAEKLLSARSSLIRRISFESAASLNVPPYIQEEPIRLSDEVIHLGGEPWRLLQRVATNHETANSDVWLAIRVLGANSFGSEFSTADVGVVKIARDRPTPEEVEFLRTFSFTQSVLLSARGRAGKHGPDRVAQLFDYFPASDCARFAFSPSAGISREEIVVNTLFDWIEQGVEALCILWGKGWLHNDVRLTNMLVSGGWGGADASDGYARSILLADYGSVTKLGATTSRGSFSPMHAAPELSSAIADELAVLPFTMQSDLYGLFASFYELISGVAPSVMVTQSEVPDPSTLEFSQWAARYASTEPPQLGDLYPGIVPIPLSDLIMRGVRSDPYERLGSPWPRGHLDIRDELISQIRRARAHSMEHATIPIVDAGRNSMGSPQDPLGWPPYLDQLAESMGYEVPDRKVS